MAKPVENKSVLKTYINESVAFIYEDVLLERVKVTDDTVLVGAYINNPESLNSVLIANNLTTQYSVSDTHAPIIIAFHTPSKSLAKKLAKSHLFAKNKKIKLAMVANFSEKTVGAQDNRHKQVIADVEFGAFVAMESDNGVTNAITINNEEENLLSLARQPKPIVKTAYDEVIPEEPEEPAVAEVKTSKKEKKHSGFGFKLPSFTSIGNKSNSEQEDVQDVQDIEIDEPVQEKVKPIKHNIKKPKLFEKKEQPVLKQEKKEIPSSSIKEEIKSDIDDINIDEELDVPVKENNTKKKGHFSLFGHAPKKEVPAPELEDVNFEEELNIDEQGQGDIIEEQPEPVQDVQKEVESVQKTTNEQVEDVDVVDPFATEGSYFEEENTEPQEVVQENNNDDLELDEVENVQINDEELDNPVQEVVEVEEEEQPNELEEWDQENETKVLKETGKLPDDDVEDKTPINTNIKEPKVNDLDELEKLLNEIG